MENLVPAAIVGALPGLAAGLAVHPLLGWIVFFGVTYGYAMLIGDSGLDTYESDSSSDTMLLWEYQPGQFRISSHSGSGGQARYISLTDPDSGLTDAYEIDGGYIGRLRKVGPGQWERM